MQRRTFAMGLALVAMTAGVRAQRAPATGDRLLQMQPRVSTTEGETHSSLAVSNGSFGAGGTPYRFAGRMRTVRQLRRGSKPNAWEVAWLFWNFGDNDHLYYFILKPNGWEVGKRDPRYVVPGVNDGQKIMATGESVKAVIGQWYEFDIRVHGAVADIFIDGKRVCRFEDKDTRPLLAGRVGLYTEDALCQWDDVTAPVADSFDREPLQAFADGSQLANWRIAFLGYGSGGIVAGEPSPF